MDKITQLKDLAAAYEAAKHCDACPDENEVEEVFNEINTNFSLENFKRGAKAEKGSSYSNVAESIILLISQL